MSLPARPEVFGEFLLVRRVALTASLDVAIAVRLGDWSGRAFVVKRPRLGERASGATAQALVREADVLERVRHGNLVALEARGNVGGLPFVALDHVRGASLARMLAAGPLAHDVAAAVARDVAAGLGALHAAGWVHGGLDPANVLVDDEGEAHLVDLAAAKRAEGDAAAVDVAAWGRLVAKAAPGFLAPRVAAAIGDDPAARPRAADLAAAIVVDAAARSRLAQQVEHALGTTSDPPEVLPPLSVERRAPRRPRRPAVYLAIGALSVASGWTLAKLTPSRAPSAPPAASTATVSLGGPLPRRTTLEIDGRPIALDPTAREPIAPGRHTLTVVTGRGDARDVPLVVHPGERVVLLPLARGAGAWPEEAPP